MRLLKEDGERLEPSKTKHVTTLDPLASNFESRRINYQRTDGGFNTSAGARLAPPSGADCGGRARVATVCDA